MDFKNNSPLVFKIRFYKPNKINPTKNAAHINYIATRPGVEKNNINEEIDKEIKDDLDSPAAHIKYAAERPGSHGLFGREETPNLEEIKRELREHKGIVWRSIISLREDDAIRLNHIDKSSWENTLRCTLPKMAEKMGIRESNLEWVAAFHAEKEHPHVHLVFWEKSPQRTTGKIIDNERKDIRRILTNEIFAEERTKLYLEKNTMRDLLRDTAKGDIGKTVEIIKSMKAERLEVQTLTLNEKRPGIAPKLRENNLEELTKKLDSLSKLLPGKGKAILAYMPEDIKKQAREIAEWILIKPGYTQSLERYNDAVEGITRHHTINEDSMRNAKNNAYLDIRDRIAQVIIKGAVEISKFERKIEYQENMKENYGDHIQQIRSEQVATRVWKSVWSALEKEKMMSEAQAEILKRKLTKDKNIKYKTKQSNLDYSNEME